MFSRLEKPYYTIVGDFVVFSNDPKTLGLVIDSYVAERTLANDEAFEEYLGNYDRKNSMFLYFNSRNFSRNMVELMNTEHREAMEHSVPYFDHFPMIGWQFVAKDKLLGTKFYMEYRPPEATENWFDLMLSNDLSSDSLASVAVEEEELITPDRILPDDLTGKKQVEHYDNGQVRFEVSFKRWPKEWDLHRVRRVGPCA